MSGMGSHPANADLVTRLSKRCRHYEDTIAQLRRELAQAQQALREKDNQ